MSNGRTWESARNPEDLARFFVESANAGDVMGVFMTTTCLQCGASLPSDVTCMDRFNTTQIKEVENPGSYYVVHHLGVPCYMLQHNAYSRQGWLETRRLLHQFVYEGLTPAEARRRNRREMDSGQRTWSLTKGTKLTQVGDIVWTRTIADVRLDSAEHYCEDVREWAIAVLADTEALVHAVSSES